MTDDVRPDPDEMARALAARLALSPWVELRCITPDRAGAQSRWVGPGADVAAAVAWAVAHNEASAGVYATFNRIDDKPGTYSARDAHVTGRVFVFVDVDPVRPTAAAATPDQHRAADAVADAVADDLALAGWGLPAERVDTGNGAALYYRCEPGVTAAAVNALLHALHVRHGSADVRVDTSVSNAARVSRLPGSVNAKGGTPRPCRVTFRAPDQTTVTVSQVEAAGAGVTPPPGAAAGGRPTWLDAPIGPADADHPGADFNARGDWWRDVLLPAGAKPAGKAGDVEHVTRPGKEGGTSATLGFYRCKDGTPALYPFTDAWPELSPNKPTDLYGAFTRLFHGGDFGKAAAVLLARGYGRERPKPAVKIGPAAGGPAVPAARRAVRRSPPFPAGLLPPVMDMAVAKVALAVGCDAGFAALPALVLGGAAIGTAAVISPKADWFEPPAVWAAVVGDSGTAKSPAADPFFAIAGRIEDDLDRDHKRKCEDEAAADRPPPPRTCFLTEDVTVERLIEDLAASPRGLLVWHDELANWFGGFTRYKGKAGGSDAPRWLGMFDGRAIGFRRRTGFPRDIRVARPLASVFGGIQPDVLRGVLADPGYVASGLAGRVVFSCPLKRCVRWNDVVFDRQALADFEAVVRDLRGLKWASEWSGVVPPAGTPPGRYVAELGRAARGRYVEFADHCAEMAENEDGGPMAAALPKLGRLALRLALVHHAFTLAAAGRAADIGNRFVDDAAMDAGIGMARWFADQAERLYGIVAERPEQTADRQLCELVQRKGGAITPRDLHRANPRRFPAAEHAEAALDALVSAGLGEWRDRPTTATGGRPTREFLVRMQTVSATDETPFLAGELADGEVSATDETHQDNGSKNVLNAYKEVVCVDSPVSSGEVTSGEAVV